jgi:hypothetical protein
VVAPLFAAGERQMLTQRVEQCSANIKRYLLIATIDA